ncbi:MAG: BsaA family SipW-dependent biofilm matrix protein [Clostridia bacterium]
MTKKAKSAIGLSALVVISAVGGTFAYWNQTATIDNPFDTGTYGTSLVENFTPEDGEDWEPGATIDKEVYVTNEGDYDLIVRAKLDETWTYTDEETAYKTVNSTSDKNADTYLDIYSDVYQYSETDGKIVADGTVVAKTFSNSTNWVDGGDGWYYYTVNVAPGEETDLWLTDVTLDEDVDMGVYNQTYYLIYDNDGTSSEWIEYTYADVVPTYYGSDGTLYYDETEVASLTLNTDYFFVTNNKVTTTLDDTLKGYSDSDYVLTITVETVQATEAAVEDMFGITLAEVTYDANWTYYTGNN